MKIMVNGEEKEAGSDICVNDYVKSLGLDPQTVVVEINGLLLKREECDLQALKQGDALEIIRFVGGG